MLASVYCCDRHTTLSSLSPSAWVDDESVELDDDDDDRTKKRKNQTKQGCIHQQCKRCNTDRQCAAEEDEEGRHDSLTEQGGDDDHLLAETDNERDYVPQLDESSRARTKRPDRRLKSRLSPRSYSTTTNNNSSAAVVNYRHPRVPPLSSPLESIFEESSQERDATHHQEQAKQQAKQQVTSTLHFRYSSSSSSSGLTKAEQRDCRISTSTQRYSDRQRQDEKKLSKKDEPAAKTRKRRKKQNKRTDSATVIVGERGGCLSRHKEEKGQRRPAELPDDPVWDSSSSDVDPVLQHQQHPPPAGQHKHKPESGKPDSGRPVSVKPKPVEKKRSLLDLTNDCSLPNDDPNTRDHLSDDPLCTMEFASDDKEGGGRTAAAEQTRHIDDGIQPSKKKKKKPVLHDKDTTAATTRPPHTVETSRVHHTNDAVADTTDSGSDLLDSSSDNRHDDDNQRSRHDSDADSYDTIHVDMEDKELDNDRNKRLGEKGDTLHTQSQLTATLPCKIPTPVNVSCLLGDKIKKKHNDNNGSRRTLLLSENDNEDRVDRPLHTVEPVTHTSRSLPPNPVARSQQHRGQADKPSQGDSRQPPHVTSTNSAKTRPKADVLVYVPATPENDPVPATPENDPFPASSVVCSTRPASLHSSGNDKRGGGAGSRKEATVATEPVTDDDNTLLFSSSPPTLPLNVACDSKNNKATMNKATMDKAASSVRSLASPPPPPLVLQQHNQSTPVPPSTPTTTAKPVSSSKPFCPPPPPVPRQQPQQKTPPHLPIGGLRKLPVDATNKPKKHTYGSSALTGNLVSSSVTTTTTTTSVASRSVASSRKLCPPPADKTTRTMVPEKTVAPSSLKHKPSTCDPAPERPRLMQSQGEDREPPFEEFPALLNNCVSALDTMINMLHLWPDTQYEELCRASSTVQGKRLFHAVKEFDVLWNDKVCQAELKNTIQRQKQFALDTISRALNKVTVVETCSFPGCCVNNLCAPSVVLFLAKLAPPCTHSYCPLHLSSIQTVVDGQIVKRCVVQECPSYTPPVSCSSSSAPSSKTLHRGHVVPRRSLSLVLSAVSDAPPLPQSTSSVTDVDNSKPSLCDKDLLSKTIEDKQLVPPSLSATTTSIVVVEPLQHHQAPHRAPHQASHPCNAVRVEDNSITSSNAPCLSDLVVAPRRTEEEDVSTQVENLDFTRMQHQQQEQQSAKTMMDASSV